MLQNFKPRTSESYVWSRAEAETDSSKTKTTNFSVTKIETGLDLNFGFETETGKVQDQDGDGKNDVINSFFDFLKKIFWSSYFLISWFYDYIN